MQVGTLHAKVDDTLDTWELRPTTKGFPRSRHLFSCSESLDGAQKECLHGHDKYKEMFKNSISIKASGYQNYLCPICPREVMSKFLNVVVNIN